MGVWICEYSTSIYVEYSCSPIPERVVADSWNRVVPTPRSTNDVVVIIVLPLPSDLIVPFSESQISLHDDFCLI